MIWAFCPSGTPCRGAISLSALYRRSALCSTSGYHLASLRPAFPYYFYRLGSFTEIYASVTIKDVAPPLLISIKLFPFTHDLLFTLHSAHFSGRGGFAKK